MEPYHANIEELTEKNDAFRKVIFTGEHSQLVLMSLPPGESIGVETHEAVDQFFRVESGKGEAIVAGKTYPLSDGTALVVPAGAEHNLVNTGEGPLKLYTIYSPPNHIPGRLHRTKAQAEADSEDEAFGHGKESSKQ